jgi:hypothetical protein
MGSAKRLAYLDSILSNLQALYKSRSPIALNARVIGDFCCTVVVIAMVLAMVLYAFSDVRP